MNNEEIVKAIKWHRENLALTSTQVALSLSINKTTYSKIENSKRIVSASELKIIANLFNMTMDDLISIPTKKIKTNFILLK